MSGFRVGIVRLGRAAGKVSFHPLDDSECGNMAPWAVVGEQRLNTSISLYCVYRRSSVSAEMCNRSCLSNIHPEPYSEH